MKYKIKCNIFGYINVRGVALCTLARFKITSSYIRVLKYILSGYV
jgi:hypothetical protein